MNNKIITHETASEQLKHLEKTQRRLKALRDLYFKTDRPKASKCQKSLEENKKEINTLLSIVHWHKMAKKMFFQLNKKE